MYNIISQRNDKILRSYKVSASVLSADLLNLESEIRKLEKSGVNMIHFDVMDGIFVNNITYGLPVLKSIQKLSPDMLLDVHLMITNPLKYVREFAESGADIITFHIESKSNTMRTIEELYKTNVKRAIAIKPDTPAESVFPYMKYLDMVLVMTVEPGFGGQKFMDMTDKIKAVRNYADENNLDIDIQVDGGIDDKTAPIVKKAGANILVSGSYLFRSENLAETADGLRKAVD